MNDIICLQLIAISHWWFISQLLNHSDSVLQKRRKTRIPSLQVMPIIIIKTIGIDALYYCLSGCFSRLHKQMFLPRGYSSVRAWNYLTVLHSDSRSRASFISVQLEPQALGPASRDAFNSPALQTEESTPGWSISSLSLSLSLSLLSLSLSLFSLSCLRIF